MLFKKFISIFSIIFLLFSASTLWGCQPAHPEISLNPPENKEAITAPTPQYQPSPPHYSPDESFVRLAIAPVVSPPQTRENYRKLLTYLPEELGHPVELVLRTTYAEISQLLKQGHCDAALIGSWSYVDLEASDDIELLVVPEIKGETNHHSYIIVSTESDVESLQELRDNRFVFTDPLSFPGKQYVAYLLHQWGETPDTFFSEYIYSYSHYNSLIAVAEGWVTAAAVESNVYKQLLAENPELAEKVKIIEESPPTGNPPIVISSQFPSHLREKMENIFLTMHENEEGRRALEEMQVERFVEGNDDDYDIIREIMDELEGES